MISFCRIMSRCSTFQARRKQFGIGGANIPGGSPSRGSDVTSKNVWKGGGRRKICITITLTRYMQG